MDKKIFSVTDAILSPTPEAKRNPELGMPKLEFFIGFTMAYDWMI